MNDTKPLSNVLVLNGARYRLEEVLQQAKLAPIVTIKAEDINPFDDKQLPECIVSYEPSVPQMELNGVLFYKQLGKYTVLSGRKHIELAKTTPGYKGEHIGRLLSTPVLKKARVQPEQKPQLNTQGVQGSDDWRREQQARWGNDQPFAPRRPSVKSTTPYFTDRKEDGRS